MQIKLLILSDLHAYSAGREKEPSFIEANGTNNSPKTSPLYALRKFIEETGLTADYLICPGDLCDKADINAAQFAWQQIESISTHLKASQFFAVTGNHDLDSRYKNPNTVDPKEAFRAIHPPFPVPNRTDLNRDYWENHFTTITADGVRFLLVDSCATHGLRPGEIDHGRISKDTLDKIEEALISSNESNGLINVAVCHHHPQQHSEFELGEYDVMRGGQQFLDLFGSGQFGKWLVIHGHKHHPKVTYASGSNMSPVVFSAGSVAFYLPPQIYGATRNTFHVLSVENDNTSSTLQGEVETYEFIYTKGWRPASESASLPHRTGFGYRGDLDGFADEIESLVPRPGGAISFSQLAKSLPRLRRVMPLDAAQLFKLLRERHSILSAHDSHQKELLLYRLV